MDIHASSLHRAMYCAGSLFFKDLPPQEPGEAAKEGTAAAEYLEKLIKGESIGTHASNGVPFDEDMEFFAKQTLKEIPLSEVSIMAEERVDWSLTSNYYLKGRLDVAFVKNDVLHVDDYKYGFGLIEAEENWQLLGYAIGTIIKLGEAFKTIKLRIHQPRAHHEDGTTRTWEITYDDLVGYKKKIQERFRSIEEGNDHLMTGPYCKYCPAAASCPAFNKAYHRSVEVIQSFVQDDLSDEELSFQLDLINRIEDLVKTRKDSLEQLAIYRLKENKLIPNYVTKERYGHRKWKPGVTAESIKLLTGIDVSKSALLSPAQAEKRGLPEQLLNDLASRPLLGQKLKRVDSKKLGDKIFGIPK